MADVTIHATKNGPYLVRGPIELFDTTGNKIKVEKETIALCRCGGSTTKPFCDGTHSKIGFQAAEAAVEDADST
jgi:CDGSH-type Zn-finger protein